MYSLYNTLSGSVELFEPIDSSNIKMYVCGPTVYDDIHVGNARPLIVFDMLAKLIRYHFGADSLTYVMNITDVDDKIVNRVSKDATVYEYRKFVYEQTSSFLKVFNDLGVDSVTKHISVIQNISFIVDCINKLIKDDHAYVSGGHVFFSSQHAQKYNHGILSNRKTLEDPQESRIGVNEYKRSQSDFVLWKPVDRGMTFRGPQGLMGRPGWHIECSAISAAYLGPRIDIHGGGVDLVYPHHENERVQSCCLGHTDKPVNYWVHNGTVNVDGAKMSKSKGNVILLKDAIAEHGADVVRFNILRSHYKHPMNWTTRSIEESSKLLNKYKLASVGVETTGRLPTEAQHVLSYNLNTPLVFTYMNRFYKEKNYEAVAEIMRFFNFYGDELGWRK